LPFLLAAPPRDGGYSRGFLPCLCYGKPCKNKLISDIGWSFAKAASHLSHNGPRLISRVQTNADKVYHGALRGELAHDAIAIVECRD
jgi:hypothetical protein